VAPLNRRAGGWNPSALAPPSEDRTEHSIQSVLDAIDVALAGESAPDEEDGVPFDA